MYGSLHTHSGDLGINRCKTQEKDSDGEEPRVKADVCNKEFEQNMTRDGDGQASHEDPKDVIKTSIKDTTVKIVNNNMRLNHETGQREKHRAWSP